MVISYPLIHALGDLSQAHTGIRTQVLNIRGGRLTNWAIPSPSSKVYCNTLCKNRYSQQNSDTFGGNPKEIHA